MESQLAGRGRVSADRIGGIGSTEVLIDEGVTVLAGRNATNRTSLLRAIMAAMGSDDVSLRGDAAEGRTAITVDGERYTRRLVRENGTVRFDGTPYLEDPTSAELFAFLLEDNAARRAVARGGDLRELIMRPVDTEELNAEIRSLKAERDEIDESLARLDDVARELADAESRRTALSRELAETEERLAERRADLEAADGTPADAGAAADDLEEALDALRDASSSLEATDRRLRTERESIEALEADRSDAERALADLPEASSEAIESVEREIEGLREHRRTVESTIARLGKVIEFNEEMLDGSGPELATTSTDAEATDGEITDRLLDDGTVDCWTCGSEVEAGTIEGTLSDLRSLRREHVRTREELAAELSELTDRREELERRLTRREELSAEVERLEAELAERRERVAELTDRREELSAEVDRLEARVSDLQSDQQDALLEAHRETTRLEMEADRLRSELAERTAEIERLEAELADRDRLTERREEVVDRLAACRTRIERLEEGAIEAFNDHIAEVLDVLAYENVERVWIEGRDRSAASGDEAEPGSTGGRAFELHVVRSGESGRAYEDTIEHLSESEREVVGLVFALAGYLVHEVHEEIPFMLLDSLEALDAERIARLVEYLAAYPDYLVVALLPEDAAALDDAYPRVTDI